jgi:hypothetical protein
MNQHVVAVCCLVLGICCSASSDIPQEHAGALRHPEHGFDWGIGGMGGVYLYPDVGELVIEVAKRDLNASGRHTELRAILFGPDRHVLAEESIPDDGQKAGSGIGPLQTVTITVPIIRPGVYGLNITASQDRYGDACVWGFRTNCPRYIIETSRGHRDSRHQEPIVLLRPDRPADVTFLPRPGAFDITLRDLPDDPGELIVYDEQNRQVAALTIDEDGVAAHSFESDPNRGSMPWRLHLAKAQANIDIEGVTLWEADDLIPNAALWSPNPASWFPLPEYRWLIFPYQQLLYAAPGTQATCDFTIHNNSQTEQQIALELEYPDEPWNATLSRAHVIKLPPGDRNTVEVSYIAPPDGEERVVHLRATPTEASDFSTFATLRVRGGTAPASDTLDMPIALRPYMQENSQFGYAPDYPLSNEVYFDLENRPFIRVSNGIATLHNGSWTITKFTTETVALEAPLDEVPRSIISTKICFDADNDVYLLAGAGTQVALLHSSDNGQSFRAYPVLGREDESRSFDIEQYSGHNTPQGPPSFVRYTRTHQDTEQALFWRRVNDLDLFVPTKQNGRIVMGDPVRLSDVGLGVAMHSGPPATVVSRGDKVHVCWGEATDPETQVPGVPAYVATYDRQTGSVGKPALIGYGPPANDIHNTPSITMDSTGRLHVIVGTHGSPFLYAHSLQPDDAHSGWTEPIQTSEGARQTYIGMVCGPDDALHLVFRLWKSGEDPYPVTSHARLAYQRKLPGQDWEPPTALVLPAFGEYGVYYHRLTADRRGALMLSYEYWSTFWFYRNDRLVRTRSVLTSPDGGHQWKLW